GFLTELKDAVRVRRPFDPRTGLPEAEVTEDEAVSWYAHARSYTEAKWANLAPVSRRSVAAALDGPERASLPVTDLEDTAPVRLALGACAATLAGKPAAGSTQRRKRSVFYN